MRARKTTTTRTTTSRADAGSRRYPVGARADRGCGMASAWRWLRGLVLGAVRSWRATYLNFRDHDAPFFVKVRLFARNKWTMARTLSMCCGNLGEPGC